MSVRSGIRFYTPEIVVEVGISAVNAIRAELEKIAVTNPPRPDVTRLLDELELHVADLDLSGPTFTLDDTQFALLLRATDHLRNLGRQSDVLEYFRDTLSRTGDVQPISYRLRSITGGPPFGFMSYSGSYDVGDRLVDARHSEYRIVDLGPGDPPELVVDAWRPAE